MKGGGASGACAGLKLVARGPLLLLIDIHRVWLGGYNDKSPHRLRPPFDKGLYGGVELIFLSSDHEKVGLSHLLTYDTLHSPSLLCWKVFRVFRISHKRVGSFPLKGLLSGLRKFSPGNQVTNSPFQRGTGEILGSGAGVSPTGLKGARIFSPKSCSSRTGLLNKIHGLERKSR